MPRPKKRPDRAPGLGPVPSVTERAVELLWRIYHLNGAEYAYKPLIYHLKDLMTGRRAGNPFAARIDPNLLPTLERILEEEIRPQKRQVWAEYVRLFGFEWGDWVRVTTPRKETVEVESTELLGAVPGAPEPSATLFGRTLKKDGKPGSRIAQTQLVVGVTKVVVLSAVANRK